MSRSTESPGRALGRFLGEAIISAFNEYLEQEEADRAKLRRVCVHSRVWDRPLHGIELADIGTLNPGQPAPEGWIEFIEVRK